MATPRLLPGLLLTPCPVPLPQLALARLLDAAGSSEAAMKQWRAAAKAGECEGQLRYGLALYKGEAGCMQVGAWGGRLQALRVRRLATGTGLPEQGSQA